jgi:hypothetical protein
LEGGGRWRVEGVLLIVKIVKNGLFSGFLLFFNRDYSVFKYTTILKISKDLNE